MPRKKTVKPKKIQVKRIQIENARVIAESVENILINSTNDNFKRKCYNILAVSNSKQAHCRIFENILTKIFSNFIEVV